MSAILGMGSWEAQVASGFFGWTSQKRRQLSQGSESAGAAPAAFAIKIWLWATGKEVSGQRKHRGRSAGLRQAAPSLNTLKQR